MWCGMYLGDIIYFVIEDVYFNRDLWQVRNIFVILSVYTWKCSRKVGL
jgi:glycopeptide antibiotics resistance protein